MSRGGALITITRGQSQTSGQGLFWPEDNLPAITTFLNRLLVLTIDMQGVLFSALGKLPEQRIEGAIAAGDHDLGLETVPLCLLFRDWVYLCRHSAAETTTVCKTAASRLIMNAGNH
ncbi:strawberry notch C-terminal domain-containing protein [Roseinatronobacter sp. S2]|uniref:strawberry notch C-terminal domain-containing protein n=1 Tax=Roseinatronobacter sp. S2 TaxID=3035471 RepID=UPI00358F3998